jgi:hypothetical protein
LKKISNPNSNITSFLLKILEIFYIKQNFYNKLINNKKEGIDKYYSYIYLFRKEDKFNNIFIESKNSRKDLFKNFIPSNLINHLDKYII